MCAVLSRSLLLLASCCRTGIREGEGPGIYSLLDPSVAACTEPPGPLSVSRGGHGACPHLMGQLGRTELGPKNLRFLRKSSWQTELKGKLILMQNLLEFKICSLKTHDMKDFKTVCTKLILDLLIPFPPCTSET